MKTKLFIIGYLLCHLDAFDLGFIPFPWIGFAICVASAFRSQLMPYNGLIISFAVLFALLLIATVINLEAQIPFSYLSYRIINLMGFFIILNSIASRTYSSRFVFTLEDSIVTIGMFIAGVSLLVMVLHVYGIGDLPRNRTGTAGLAQSIVFTFEIGDVSHRALGTFREPSFLAMALLLPGFLAFKNKKWVPLVLIASAMYLTYSLGSLMALVFGLIFTLLFVKNLLLIAKNLCLFGLPILSILYLMLPFLLDNFFVQRLYFVFANDLADTSRGYIYSNLNANVQSWIIGDGIGSLSFRLGKLLDTDYPVSILNLFLSILTSGGVLALVMLIYWFMYPNLILRQYRTSILSSDLLLLVSVNAFILLYLTTFEEMHVWHAIALGLFLSRINELKSSRVIR